ncbi:MAG: phosphotransferase family protein [Pseudomonadota bacterium]
MSNWDWCDNSRAKLTAFLACNGLMDGAPAITPIGDGHSNLTYRLVLGDRSLVLRRPPPPPLAPGVNDVLREARVLTALWGTGVAVPHVVATGQAGDVFDVPFYLMEHVEGIVITGSAPEIFASPEAARELGEAFVDGLIQLHRVDPMAVGLNDFGRPEGFNARHLKRIAGIVTEAGAVRDEFAEIHGWLAANVPAETGATIIHNDFRLGNVMWKNQRPATLAAVLDWELAALGDPMMDFAYLLGSLPEGGQSNTPVQDFARDAYVPGFPPRAELVARYAAALPYDTSSLDWFMAFVQWKLAILYDFSRRRGADPYYRDPTQVSRLLAEARRFTGLG